ncbi:MAG: hydrogenase maturation protease [Chloroflexi bacterium]|nr:hydrogenase maturation protease [Chloroflexota bacterium]
MKVLVLGLGNPLLGDDGVGWRIVEQVAASLDANAARYTQYEIDYHAGGGLSLMERLVGYERVIIVDAINTGRASQGSVSCFRLENLPKDAASHLASAHETNLQTALEVGRQMGAMLPRAIVIVGIESQQVYDFSEELSPAVARAIPDAVRLVITQLTER